MKNVVIIEGALVGNLPEAVYYAKDQLRVEFDLVCENENTHAKHRISTAYLDSTRTTDEMANQLEAYLPAINEMLEAAEHARKMRLERAARVADVTGDGTDDDANDDSAYPEDDDSDLDDPDDPDYDDEAHAEAELENEHPGNDALA